MPYREAGERFLSSLGTLIKEKYIDVYPRQWSTGISYEIVPSMKIEPYKWESVYHILLEETKKIAREVNEEKRLPPDKAVLAQVFGSPVDRYQAPGLMLDLTTGQLEQSTKMNPITVSFSIPYFPKIK